MSAANSSGDFVRTNNWPSWARWRHRLGTKSARRWPPSTGWLNGCAAKRLHRRRMREREADIPLIALHLLDRIARSFGRTASGFAPEVINALRAYPFPGNIRELENIIKKMLVFSESKEPLGAQALPPELRSFAVNGKSGTENGSFSPAIFTVAPPFPALERVKTKYVRHILDLLGGNKRKTAETLGIGRRTLYDILERDD